MLLTKSMAIAKRASSTSIRRPGAENNGRRWFITTLSFQFELDLLDFGELKLTDYRTMSITYVPHSYQSY